MEQGMDLLLAQEPKSLEVVKAYREILKIMI